MCAYWLDRNINSISTAYIDTKDLSYRNVKVGSVTFDFACEKKRVVYAYYDSTPGGQLTQKLWKEIESSTTKDRPFYENEYVVCTVNRVPEYRDVVNGGMFSICDSSYVPLYIKWIYGRQYQQYCGSQIFKDIVSSRKYRMIFLGTQQKILDSLQRNLMQMNPAVRDMTFVELPFCSADEFDYESIARMIEADGADIVWVALGAPKQEYFMSRLKPHLKHGVMIAVGAAFKFYSGVDEKRAPKWMVDHHLEFVYRLGRDPKKQFRRCYHILATLPGLLLAERKRKRNKQITGQCGRRHSPVFRQNIVNNNNHQN